MTGTAAGLSREVADFIARSESALPPDFQKRPLARQRAMYRALCRMFDTPRPDGVAVGDDTVAAAGHEVPVRLYRPAVAGPQGCLIYLHGGGFVLGDLDSHDGIVADLASTAGLTAIAVDYRLAPEHPFPAALDDASAVLDWTVANAPHLGIDAGRIGLGGDSAGGNLAAALCLRARDRGGPLIRAQILIYPELGLWIDQGEDALAPNAPLLSRAEMRVYAAAYLGGDATTDDPYAAPLLARDYAGLPPAFISAAGHDPLRNDARVYAERLRTAGVPAELEVAPGLVHGFLRARGCCPEGAAAFARICAAAARLLGGSARTGG